MASEHAIRGQYSSFMLPKLTIKTINSIFKSFLWSGSDTPTKKAMVKWNNVCTPYQEGGLGIRCIQVSNEAAYQRHIWQLATSQSSIWAIWVRKNLVKKRDFWLMQHPKDASWCWKRILDSRKSASRLLLHSIGDGQTTKFWKDPWHPMGILMDFFPQELLYDSLLHRETKVSALLRNGRWHIPEHIHPSITDITSSLCDVEVDCSQPDEVVWRAGPYGSYTMKHTYETLRPRTTSFPWAKIVWFKGNIPRHSFILWLVLHQSLKTLVKLKRWGKVQIDDCSLCSQHPETETHMFFDCSYSSNVWSTIMRYLCYNRHTLHGQQELHWCMQNFTGNDPGVTLKKLALNATVYHLWHERNRRVYEHASRPEVTLAQTIIEDVRIKVAGLDFRIMDNAQNRDLFARWCTDPMFFHRTPIKCKWDKPPAGWYKMNSDGSLRGQRGGYGAIIRDSQGDVVIACAGSSTGHSVLKHELQGIEAGIKAAEQLHIRRLEISTDSMNVFHYITKNKKAAWDLRHLIARIIRKTSQMEDLNVKHHYREADKLASLYPSSEFIIVTPSSFAEDLKKIVYEDRIGKEYTRL